MDLQIIGQTLATPSAITVLQDGQEIFSGQVGVGQSLATDIALVPITGCPWNAVTTYSISISVTAGIVKIGHVYLELTARDGTKSLGGPDLRSNILINGQAPEWPVIPATPRMPHGTAQAPDWSDWFFEVAAGETMTFTITTPNVAPLPA